MRNLNNNKLTETFNFINYILQSQTYDCDDVTGTMTSKDSLEVEQSFYYFNDKNQRVASLALLSDRIEFSEVNEVEEQYNTLLSDTAEVEIEDEGYNNKLKQGIKEIVDKMTPEEKKVYNNFKKWGKVGDESKDETLPLHIPLAKYDDEPKHETPDGIFDYMGQPVPTPPTPEQIATMTPREIHRLQMDKYYRMREFTPQRRKEHEAIFAGMNTITGLHDGIWGNFANIRGDAMNITGDVSGINGDVTNISGCVTRLKGYIESLSGDVSNIYGNLRIMGGIMGNASKLSGDITGISGNVPDIELNLDQFNITDEHRKKGFGIHWLVENPDKYRFTVENKSTAQLKEELEKCGIKFIPSKKSY